MFLTYFDLMLTNLWVFCARFVCHNIAHKKMQNTATKTWESFNKTSYIYQSGLSCCFNNLKDYLIYQDLRVCFTWKMLQVFLQTTYLIWSATPLSDSSDLRDSLSTWVCTRFRSKNGHYYHYYSSFTHQLQNFSSTADRFTSPSLPDAPANSPGLASSKEEPTARYRGCRGNREE